MEVDILEIFKGFPEYLKKHLCEQEKDIIKRKSRFEKSIIQPYLWKYLKEKSENFCVVKEYLYEEKSQKTLDIALVKNNLLKYGIEVKALPLDTPKGFMNKERIEEINKDIEKLKELLEIKNRTEGILVIAISYNGERGKLEEELNKFKNKFKNKSEKKG